MSRDPRTHNVVIVGCGSISAVHAQAIIGRPGATIAGLVNRTKPKALALAERIESEWGAPPPPVFLDLPSALAQVDADVVVITTPNGNHAELARLALEASAHVIIEKPLDIDLAAARAVVEVSEGARATGRVVSVISQHRFDLASRIVAGAVDAGDFGRLTSGGASIAWWRGQAYYDSADWRGTWGIDGGGAALQQGIHSMDLLLRFLGRPDRIHAHTALLAHERVEVEDTCVATIRFESGALGVVHMTTAAYPGVTGRIQVHGSRGSAIIDDDTLSYFHTADHEELRAGIPPMGLGAAGNQAQDVLARARAEAPAETAPNEHAMQYAEIFDAIDTGRAPQVGAEDAFVALATIRAFYLSATLGEEVVFSDVLSGRYDALTVHTEDSPGDDTTVR